MTLGTMHEMTLCHTEPQYTSACEWWRHTDPCAAIQLSNTEYVNDKLMSYWPILHISNNKYANGDIMSHWTKSVLPTIREQQGQSSVL